MDLICDVYQMPCCLVSPTRCPDCPRRPSSTAMPVQVCPERDIECGPNANTWCRQCPKHKTMGDAAVQAIEGRKTGGLRHETSSQRMERTHTDDPGWPWPKASNVGIIAESIDGPVAIEPMLIDGKPVAYSVVDGKGLGYINGGPTFTVPGITILGQHFDVHSVSQLVAQVAAYVAIKALMEHPDQDGVLARIREAIAKAEAK